VTKDWFVDKTLLREASLTQKTPIAS